MSKPQDKTLPGFCGAKIVKSGRTAASNKQHEVVTVKVQSAN